MLSAMDFVLNGFNFTACGMIVLGIAAAVTGLVLTIRKRICCTEPVEAEVVTHQLLYHGGSARGSSGIRRHKAGTALGAVYGYVYQGASYTTYPVMRADGCDPIGYKCTLKINPKKPEQYLFTDRMNEIGGILLMLAGAVIAFMGFVKL